MSVEFRRPQFKNVLRVAAATVAVSSLIACVRSRPPGEESKWGIQDRPPTPIPDTHTLNMATNFHRYSITRLSTGGDIFLVNPLRNSGNAKEIDISEGIKLMRGFGGCEIVDIKKVNAGDIVKVINPKDCLPQLK